jgi:uncharacterized GH25 family protein
VRLVSRTSSAADLAAVASAGGLVWLRFVPSDPGGATIAFESSFRPAELPAEEFDAYLIEEGLDGPLRARLAGRRTDEDRPIRELFRRCAKIWISGGDASRITTPVGLPLEIVPERAPGAQADLPVRVLAGGAPVPNALVKAWRSPWDRSGRPQDPETRDSTGCFWSGRTDARGRVVIPTPEEGEWLVSVVRMVPSRDRGRADWESTWASLTFERRTLGWRADRR